MAESHTYLANGKNLHHTYKAQEISTSSPEKLILHLYDYAIKGCALQDESQASAGLRELIDALDFDGEREVAVGLFRLYEYAMRSVKQSAFDPPLRILRELRETWHTAMLQRPHRAVLTH